MTTRLQSVPCLADAVVIATTPSARITGLLNRSFLAPGEGLLIPHARAIHTYGMRFPIDVVFLSNTGQVLRMFHNMQPGGRVECLEASSVLELPVGRLAEAGTQIGDTVKWANEQFGGVTYPSAGMGQTVQKRPRRYGRLSGMGQTAMSGNQQAATYLASAGSVTLAIAPATGPAAPFVAAAGALMELAATIVNMFKPCGATCTEATTIVNDLEPLLQQNNQIYFTNPCRTTGDQAAALALAQTAFNLIQANCGNSALGTAGENCISQRIGNGMSVGSSKCAYGETTANEYPAYSSTPYPVGVCWTWTLAYYDSIYNDVPPGGSGPATGASAENVLATAAAAGLNAASTVNATVVGSPNCNTTATGALTSTSALGTNTTTTTAADTSSTAASSSLTPLLIAAAAILALMVIG